MKLKKFQFNKDVLLNNFWLKLVSLLIAMIIWIYISGEITKGARL